MRDSAETPASALLAWYDKNARALPWRIPPVLRKSGVQPNPYHIWLSEIMLQQTTVAAVSGYYSRFVKTWPSVFDLARAQDEDVMAAWAGLGYYARARNLLKTARIIAADFNGQFPSDEKSLRSLPGIGPYTAAAISAIAFDLPASVLDGNVERVMARLHAVTVPLPASKKQLGELAKKHCPVKRHGDYAQAIMDLGATICTPRNPACESCPWVGDCAAFALGNPAELPRKSPKPAKPTRHGVVYVAVRSDGAVLLERRPQTGLLGGMLGWPGGEWVDGPTRPLPPIEADWQVLSEEVYHTFTHFHLRLQVHIAATTMGRFANTGYFAKRETFDPADLPTVMQKVWRLANSSKNL